MQRLRSFELDPDRDPETRLAGVKIGVGQQLAHRPGLTNTELARGTFVSRQAMHRLLATLKSAGLVEGDGGGRHERFILTDDGAQRLLGASTAVAAVQEQMLASFDPEQRRRLYADLAACADALNR